MVIIKKEARYRFRRSIKRWLIVTNGFLIVLLALSYLSAYINPAYFVYPSFLGLVYPYLLFINILFIVFWVWQRKWYLWLSLGVILLGWPFLQSLFQLNLSTAQAEQARTFKFMSFNVRQFDRWNWSNQSRMRNRIIDFLDSQKPDVLCFQEFWMRQDGQTNIIDSLLEKQGLVHKHLAYIEEENKVYLAGVATFSRYPIVKTGEIKLENSAKVSIYSDVRVEGRTIRIFNNHLQSVHFESENYHYLDSLNNDKSGSWNGMMAIVRKLKTGYIKRAKQAKLLATAIEGSPYPVIVCGDFNDVPVSYTYRKMRSGLKDAFIESGNGFGLTYIRKFVALRIDYILHSRDLEAFDFEVERIQLSDHFPISCHFLIEKP